MKKIINTLFYIIIILIISNPSHSGVSLINNTLINDNEEILTNEISHDINKLKNILVEPDLKFVAGEIIIKFKDEINVGNFERNGQPFNTDLISVDSLNDKYDLINIEKLSEIYTPKFLSNVFVLKFDEQLNVIVAANEYHNNIS